MLKRSLLLFISASLLFIGGFFSNIGAVPVTAKPGDDLNKIANSLASGDTLILQDGTYSGGAFISLTNKSGITIKSANERQSWLRGNGTGIPIYLNGCSNITLDGLHVSNADYSSSTPQGLIYLYKCNSCTIHRNLVTNNNRYKNEAPITLDQSNGCLIEENELYWFHRNGIDLSSSSNNIVRRNYGNSRNYADIPGGNDSSAIDSTRGDHFITIYPGNSNFIENNISEGNTACISQEASGYNGVSTANNKMFGNISLNDRYGFLNNARVQDSPIGTPTNSVYENNVSIGARYNGFYIRTSYNSVGRNNTSIGSGVANFGWDKESTNGSPAPTFYFDNSLSANGSQYGFLITNQAAFLLDFANSYGGGFSPSTSPSITHSSTINPNLGGAMIWIPPTSTMKGKGKNGADIGANIINRYQNGILTSQPLWNSDGSFPHGAIISGVNDYSGASAFNVHLRLGTMPTPGSVQPVTPSNVQVVTNPVQTYPVQTIPTSEAPATSDIVSTTTQTPTETNMPAVAVIGAGVLIAVLMSK